MCDEFYKVVLICSPCIRLTSKLSCSNIKRWGFILDTIIHGLASLLNGLPASIAAIGMFIVQDLSI